MEDRVTQIMKEIEHLYKVTPTNDRYANQCLASDLGRFARAQVAGIKDNDILKAHEALFRAARKQLLDAPVKKVAPVDGNTWTATNVYDDDDRPTSY